MTSSEGAFLGMLREASKDAGQPLVPRTAARRRTALLGFLEGPT